MKILITGAAGFIGSALCQKLAINGHNVVAIDNFSTYYDVSLKKARVNELLKPLKIEVIDLDISNGVKVESLITESRLDIVINLAAQAGVRLPIQDTDKYVESNLVGFSNILRSTVANKVPYFLYASSSSVYGNKAAIPFIESEQNLHPTSATVARGLRFFTVYGPWGRPDMAYFRMIANVVSNSEFNFFGDGSIERDFTYIEDVINSIVALINELKTRNSGYSDIVNIGGGRPLSMNYLLKTIETLCGEEIKFNRKTSDRNDSVKTMSDSTYIESLIKFKPSIELEVGIDKTIRWAKREDIARNLNKWVN
jgi:UDP-glucuronate 4-epimerase